MKTNHHNANKFNVIDEQCVHIIGLGNLTRFDDGVAIRIIHELTKMNYPKSIKITDLGTGGVDIALMLDGWKYGIIIDAVKIDGYNPGDIVEFIIQDQNLPKVTGLSSTHGFDAITSLRLLYTLKEFNLPLEIRIIGIQIKSMEGLGMDLSPEVSNAIPQVIKRVNELILTFQKNK